MSGYLQRLYDRGAGGLAIMAPALRPGSPLARVDQRLALSEFAGDFSFGAILDAPAAERDEVAPLPVPVPRHDPTHGPDVTAPSAESGTRQKLAEPKRSRPESQPAPRRLKPKRKEDARGHGEVQLPSDPPKALVPAARHAATEKATVARLPADAPHPPLSPQTAPSPTPGEDAAVVERQIGRPMLADDLPTPRILAPATPVPAGEHETAIADTLPQPVAVPPKSAEHLQQIRQQVLPQPKAQPLEAVAPLELRSEAPSIDWAEVDRRIDRAVRGMSERSPERDKKRTVGHVGDDALNQQTAPIGFTTAAEASVIGPIEHSPRHRMLFGARWR